MDANLGLIHIYCGDGKGKTTAATGLAIRALGNDLKVLLSRFLKNDNSSEIKILSTLDNLTISGSERDFGFFFNMSDAEKKEASVFFTNQLENAFKNANENNYDLLILDEINVCVSLNLIDIDLLIKLIKSKAPHLELILTGRNPNPLLIELADYVSDIHCIKHPFDKGVSSRKGIEE